MKVFSGRKNTLLRHFVNIIRAHRDLLPTFLLPPQPMRPNERDVGQCEARFMIAWRSLPISPSGVVRLRSFRLPVCCRRASSACDSDSGRTHPLGRGPAAWYVLTRTPVRVLRVSTRVRPRGGTPFSKRLSLAEHHREYPDAILVDESSGDQTVSDCATKFLSDLSSPLPRTAEPSHQWTDSLAFLARSRPALRSSARLKLILLIV